MDGMERDKFKALLVRARGDRLALSQVIEHLVPPARAMLKSKFPSLTDAERQQVIDDVIVTVISDARFYDPALGDPVPYFCVGVRNVAINLLKRSRLVRRREKQFVPEEFDRLVDPKSVRSFHDASCAPAFVRIACYLDKHKLDPVEQDLLSLATGPGLFKGYATLLGDKHGISSDAVTQRWHRLKKKLRQVGLRQGGPHAD